MPPDLVAMINSWGNEAVRAFAADGRLPALGIEPAAETQEGFASAKLGAAKFEPQ